MKPIDLGPCGGLLFEQDPDRVAYLLPGAYYPSTAPLLWFARMIALHRGWTVVLVEDRYDRSVDADEWVGARFAAALAAAGSPTRKVVISKSITSRAAPLAADLELPGVWLTPLMTIPEVTKGLTVNPAPTLAIGGGADPSWDRSAAHTADIEVFEIPGADHSLGTDDPHRSLDMLRSVTDRIDRFFDVHLS